MENSFVLLHDKERSLAAQRAFYSLQGAGLHYGGVDPHVAAKLYSVGVRTLLTYGCEALHLSDPTLRSLESMQGKLVKAFLGLRKSSRTSPLLSALKIPSIRCSVGYSSLSLLRSCLLHRSNASLFHLQALMCKGSQYGSTLASRATAFAKERGINIIKYVLDCTYFRRVNTLKHLGDYQCNGIVDSIKMYLDEFNFDGARDMVQMLVNSY